MLRWLREIRARGHPSKTTASIICIGSRFWAARHDRRNRGGADYYCHGCGRGAALLPRPAGLRNPFLDPV